MNFFNLKFDFSKNDFIPDIAPVTIDGIKRPAGTLIPNVTTVNADLTFTDFIQAQKMSFLSKKVNFWSRNDPFELFWTVFWK